MTLLYMWDQFIYKIRCIFEVYESTEKGIVRDIKRGYCTSDLEPIKCHKCGGKDFESRYEDFMGYTLVEYTLDCKKCGTVVGLWSYGYWIP